VNYLGYESRNLTGRDFQFLSLGTLLKLSDEATLMDRALADVSHVPVKQLLLRVVVFLGQAIRADHGVVCFKCECIRSLTQPAQQEVL
jgi:hypothetical protein